MYFKEENLRPFYDMMQKRRIKTMKPTYLENKKIKWGIVIVAVLLLSASLVLGTRSTHSAKQVVRNFMIPTILLYFGLSEHEINKLAKLNLVILGLIWFGFIALYYLIGFHNPNLGN